MNDQPITITMPRSHWESIVEAMHWTLPELGDQSDLERSRREHSERCFKAADNIRRVVDAADLTSAS